MGAPVAILSARFTCRPKVTEAKVAEGEQESRLGNTLVRKETLGEEQGVLVGEVVEMVVYGLSEQCGDRSTVGRHLVASAVHQSGSSLMLPSKLFHGGSRRSGRRAWNDVETEVGQISLGALQIVKPVVSESVLAVGGEGEAKREA
jgi:hypothetical protein